MRFSAIIFIFFLLISQAMVLPAAADTRYVTDELVITLRQGKSNEYKIIKTLKTGTPMEVLEEDETYLKVRTPEGDEGYVLRQYVSSEIPKSRRIEELEGRNSSLQEKISTLEETRNYLEQQLKTLQETSQQEISAMNANYAEMQQRLEQALNSEGDMSEKYDTLLAQAENVVEIAAERDRLLQKNKVLGAEAAALMKKNDKLTDSRMIKWFLAGGGVFFFGWIIGKVSRKKRSRL